MACPSETEKDYKNVFETLWQKDGTTLIKFLLDGCNDINGQNEFGKSMLSLAAELGSLEMTKFLYEKGADLQSENSDGAKPLHIAACHGHLDIVKFFIIRGVSPNIFDNEGNNPLHYLSNCLPITTQFSETHEIVRFLVGRGADINCVNGSGFTPLLRVAQRGHKELVKLFLNLGASVTFYNKKKWCVLHYACCFGWRDIVLWFMRGAPNNDANQATVEGFTPMFLAARNSQREIIEVLMHFGAVDEWCNVERTTFLHCCCANGWLDYVEYLVNAGFDVNAMNVDGLTPFAMAVTESHLYVVEYLLDCGANYKDFYHKTLKRTLLHVACEEEWLDLVIFLIKDKCDLNAQDECNDTPLHLAIRERSKEIVKCLLKAGADWNLENNKELTAFTECIRDYFDVEYIDIFIENGAYFRDKDHEEMQILRTKGLLQDVIFCSKAFMNHLENAYLPKVYNLPVFAKRLPPMIKMQILSNPVVQHIVESVSLEIETKGFCDVLRARPIMLRSLCTKRLVEYYDL